MKRLNGFCCPYCGCTLKTGCIVIGIVSVVVCIFDLIFGTAVIANTGGFESWNEKVELIWFAIAATMYLFLVYGAIKGKRGYLVPSLIAFVGDIIYLLYLSITQFDAPVDQREAEEYIVDFLVTTIAVIGLFIYFWIVVWSHFLELGEIHERSHENFGVVYKSMPPTPVNVIAV